MEQYVIFKCENIKLPEPSSVEKAIFETTSA